MQQQFSKQRRVHLVSLGCARNRVDSEVMLGTLLGDGWSHTSVPQEADAIIVNTCGFIESAKEESIDHILSAAELKKSNPDLRLVVAGCLTQRYKRQLSKGLPEVDLFVGTDEFASIGKFLEKPLPSGTVKADRTHYLYTDTLPRLNTLGGGAAYVKVAEGCDHHCAFCIIPAIRGRLRSRPIESVVNEVRNLVNQGVLEVNLIAQDLAAYGRDRDLGVGLLDLLKAICAVEGLRWVRPLYVYPEHISDQFLDFMATEPKLVKYLDIPVQHASDSILAAMNREITREQLSSSIKKLRQRVPNVAIRTSVMVGFPGETEEDFLQLLSFIEEMRFDHLGCFTYSAEAGTVAARLPDQVDSVTMEQRYNRVMQLQQTISKDLLANRVGDRCEVLITKSSSEDPSTWQGRVASQAPEVDGVVSLRLEGGREKVAVGSIVPAVITGSRDYDLVARLV